MLCKGRLGRHKARDAGNMVKRAIEMAERASSEQERK